ncbi:sensor histidine kinase [Gilvimarinus sp. SDUM040013]|uniref:Sensor histidine kinase n=1 Tax=Gilvimarinus gilvus TaxID=3058038 RepID=A0ABU4S1W5_9GAMM|nr:sensor histidine kinase [Gilvimarinus sp. SDUM040013]MDO3384410.1 sensor histidine kinase [Gilvimarinus sp. SDUM040013]MDX6851015.1 sensor histidine kinase [Gilvimarinus sp. SDUM040013]
MGQGSKQHNSAQTTPGGSGGLIPNLCSGYALLLLVLAAELLAVLLAVSSSGLRYITWAHLGLVSFLVQWVVLSSAAILCYLQPKLIRLGAVAAGLISYAIVLLVTASYSIVGQWLLRGLDEHSIDWWPVANNLVIAALLAGIVLRYLYLQQLLRHQQEAELRARIQALQSRIEPHFLFNSMNSIASLIAVDPILAERQVEDLSDLLRASIAEAALIPAQRELQLCQSYLHIQQARLGERLKVGWQVEELPAGLVLPNLLMQPLVENAIKHGIEPSTQGGALTVRAAVEGDQLTLSVTNPKPAQRSDKPADGNRMALLNIQHRLAAHFGSAAQLKLNATEDEFTVSINIGLSACSREPSAR